MSARKPKSEGVVSLIKPEAPSIEEITLRDWFAAFAMQALFPIYEKEPSFDLSERAYAAADRMLLERKK